MECVKQVLSEVIEDDLYSLRDDGETMEKDVRAAKVKEVCELADRFIKMQEIETDAQAEADKVQMEKEQKERMADLEEAKAKLDWKKVSFDLVKIMLPVVFQSIAFGIYQKRTIKFEEDGSLKSWSSKEMHFPKFWK